jgi:hypothetical protein
LLAEEGEFQVRGPIVMAARREEVEELREQVQTAGPKHDASLLVSMR